MGKYTPTIGLEIHAELKTESKMFCGCKNDPHAAEENTLICPVCLAHPGTLPTVNKKAVEHVLTVGTAIEGSVATYSEFDRKNYFYPDIPKAYQISQYAFPFVSGGSLKGVDITRIHLEEDTARSQHDQGNGSLVDFNRAGVPLMELVTEPVIHDAKTAGDFARELQLLLRTLGVSDANMERGEMRVEANISISNSDKLGTKVEVKNLNSFKVMEQAIEYEIKRHAKALDAGETISQETRGWDEAKGATFSQRTKEVAEEYRYFPDPDIPKYELSEIPEFSNSRLKENLPILPQETRISLSKVGVPDDQIEILLSQNHLLEFLNVCIESLGSEAKKIKTASNYLTSDIVSLLQNDPDSVLDIQHAPMFVELIGMAVESKITSRVAKDLLPEVLRGMDPKVMAEERGLLQSNSEEDLLPIIEQVISENPDPVAEFKAGKDASLKFLIGQGMRLSKGSANPGTLTELFTKKIKS